MKCMPLSPSCGALFLRLLVQKRLRQRGGREAQLGSLKALAVDHGTFSALFVAALKTPKMSPRMDYLSQDDRSMCLQPLPPEFLATHDDKPFQVQELN